MKSTGIVRRLDELGRITLPIELRRNFDVNERDPLEIFVDDDKIILKKYNPADIFTGEDMDDLIDLLDSKLLKRNFLDHFNKDKQKVWELILFSHTFFVDIFLFLFQQLLINLSLTNTSIFGYQFHRFFL